ncbi:MAG: hypothetical protein AB8G14_01630 [Ilumatobacter sp.]
MASRALERPNIAEPIHIPPGHTEELAEVAQTVEFGSAPSGWRHQRAETPR